jgi:hypothetical protein
MEPKAKPRKAAGKTKVLNRESAAERAAEIRAMKYREEIDGVNFDIIKMPGWVTINSLERIDGQNESRHSARRLEQIGWQKQLDEDGKPIVTEAGGGAKHIAMCMPEEIYNERMHRRYKRDSFEANVQAKVIQKGRSAGMRDGDTFDAEKVMAEMGLTPEDIFDDDDLDQSHLQKQAEAEAMNSGVAFKN